MIFMRVLVAVSVRWCQVYPGCYTRFNSCPVIGKHFMTHMVEVDCNQPVVSEGFRGRLYFPFLGVLLFSPYIIAGGVVAEDEALGFVSALAEGRAVTQVGMS